MSRMTDEQYARFAKDQEPALENHEQVMAHCFQMWEWFVAERAKVAELEAVIRTDPDYAPWARLEAAEAQLTALPKWAQSSESKGQFYRKSIQEMAALREQLTALQTAIDATGEVHPSWSTSKEFQDGWRECIAHIREDAGRPATYFSQMRAELSELREGCQALIDGWEATVEEPLDMPDFVIRDCARELQSLLTQPTPTDNSAEAVNSGEDSDTARVAGKL